MKLSPPQIAELGNRAREHFQHRRLHAALKDFEALCRLCPRDPGAWHMLGVVYASLGDMENAVRCARQTTQLAPSNASGQRNLGHFLLQLGRTAEAEASFRKALALSAGDPMDHANLGAALAAQDRHAAAIDCYETAKQRNPVDPTLQFNLAASYHALGRWPEAVRHYERASQLAPDEPRYRAGLAAALHASGQDELALAAWSRVLQQAANDPQALLGIGIIYRQRDQLTTAETFFARAVEAAPGASEPLMYLGLTHLDLGNTDQALCCFDAVLEHEPDNPQAQYNRALALERSGLLEAALEGYAGVSDGDHGLDLMGARAGILEKLGDYEAAHALLEPVLAQGAASMRTLNAYARLCRHFGECDRAIEQIEARLRSAEPDDTERCQLHFWAGELCDRQQRYDEAFRHFTEGNRLKGYQYNVDDDIRYVDRLTEIFSPETFARLPGVEPAADVTPIFIVGMPRSGTTLVEQILASHSAIHAGDELPFIARIVTAQRSCAGRMLGYPEYLPYLTAADCAAMARAYLDELRALAPGAAYVTDKMPHNFPFLGLLQRLFPNAPIIHCLRDPIDVCLSCYFQDFASHHNYAYDLAHLGLHYRQYQRTLRHFRDTLGVPMFETQYEALVDDPETRSRALIAYCGLPWEDACLRFYASGRNSKTASYDQVRQPIYTRSAQRWRNYERHLEPLFAALAVTPTAAEPDSTTA